MTAPLLVDAKAAAALLGISLRSWLRLVQRGKAPAPIRLGRLVRWRVADLESWIALKAAEEGSGAQP